MEETGLVLRPFVNLWIVLVLALLFGAFSVVAYARTTRPVSRRFKLLLLALRFCAIALVLVCLLRPSLQTTHHELARRPLLLLIDQSRSMKEIHDTPSGVSRLEAVDHLLEENKSRLEALKEQYDLVLLGFARDLLTGGPQEREAAANYSAYGLAIQKAFAEMTNSRSDAVVVIGDGSHNWGPPDPVDVAAALNEQGVAVFTVGVGQDQATSELRDVKVLDISAPKTALLFTSFSVRADVMFRGCQGLPVKVRLDSPGLPSTERTVTVSHSEETVPLEFEVVPEKIGEYRVTVSAEAVPNEVLQDNNSRSTFVKVISSGVRVAFFDVTRPESKFIARSLQGAEHVDLRRVLILPGQKLPPAQVEMERYDVAILGDLPASALLPSQMLHIRRAVQEDGKGLAVLLSQRSGGRSGWRGTALEDLLPVRFAGSVRIATGKRQFRVALEDATHPVLTLAATAQATVDAWNNLPPLAGAVAGLQLKRGATVLASDQDGNPLLVVHRAGRGRVACLLADTTFLWFFTERDTQDYHRRFWRQLAMWTAGREEEPQGGFWIELSKAQLLVDEELKIKLHLAGRDDQPIRDAQLVLRITSPGGETADLAYAFSRQEGAYVAEYSPSLSGEYTVSAEATRDDQFLGRDSCHFHAHSLDLELEDPIADLKLLRRISAVTKEAGGRYYHYLQADELFHNLEERGEPLKLTTRKRRDIWDSWPLFALFAACVVAEWTLRKWKGLV